MKNAGKTVTYDLNQISKLKNVTRPIFRYVAFVVANEMATDQELDEMRTFMKEYRAFDPTVETNASS